MLPVIFLVGATATGKSEAAVRLAEALDAEIVSADSVQVCRGLDIGSAKPDAALRARVPHHLLDMVAPDQPYSAADFRRDALRVIGEIAARGKRALVAGGTGLYVRALTDGLCAAPAGDDALRARLLAETGGDPAAVHARLHTVDPVAAEKCGPHNARRLLRALEVYELSGKPLSQWWQETPPAPWPFVMLGLQRERAELYARIDARVARMWQGGLLDECRTLLAQYPPGLKPLRTLGYRHAIAYLRGEWDEAHARRLMARDTRHFAKRQQTWFGPDARIRWFTPSREKEMLDAVRAAA